LEKERGRREGGGRDGKGRGGGGGGLVRGEGEEEKHVFLCFGLAIQTIVSNRALIPNELAFYNFP
jgi:hypothetical protein